MNSIESPNALPGVIIAVAWIFLSLAASRWLYDLDGLRGYSSMLMISCMFAAPAGAAFNNYRRERFARAHDLRVCYRSNIFGKGKFFSGYRNKAGKESFDAAELID